MGGGKEEEEKEEEGREVRGVLGSKVRPSNGVEEKTVVNAAECVWFVGVHLLQLRKKRTTQT